MMEEQYMEKQTGEVRISKRTLILIIIIVLLLIGGGVFVGLNWNNWFGDNTEEKFTPDIDENAKDWSDQAADDNDNSKGIKIPGYPTLMIAANKKSVPVALLNPEGNPCYFIFEVSLNDTGEVLYTSKMVPPGQAIYEMNLSRSLKAGKYQATIKISTISLEDGSAMNGAKMATELIVQ